MLIFNEKTGFSVQEPAEIREEVAQSWINAFKSDDTPDINTAPETPQGQIIDAETLAITQKDSELAFLANMFNPKTARGIWQDALAEIYFIKRKKAVNSRCYCVLTGLNGTVIEKGSKIQSSADSTYWDLLETVTIEGNSSVTALFECESEGAVIASPNTLNKIITTVAGWDTVNNSQSATVGSLEESQQAFEKRRYDSVALNSVGTTASVFSRVNQIDDVVGCYVVDNKTNVNKIIDDYLLKPHSIYVAVIGGSNQDIAEAIYRSLSAGCDYNGNTQITVVDPHTHAKEKVTFMRPTSQNVYIKVNVFDKDLPDDYENLIKNAVITNFYGQDEQIEIAGEAVTRAIMGQDIYASRFLPSILNKNISSLLSVQISLDNQTFSDYVHIKIDKEPYIDESNITVNLIEP
ncbi:MAG: baseplate J/gp47 family protein [Succinivibrio dextrinosolvens]|nr:baseplate J/gp47 family protein [Succinivibrio dextrinosolvens]MDY6470164.1 baseplate J/gp47 family protein [Succinivibrio dextrinosolvens]